MKAALLYDSFVIFRHCVARLPDWWQIDGETMGENRVMTNRKFGVELRPEERKALSEFAKRGTDRQIMAANIILQWAEGWPRAKSARELSINEKTVLRYRNLYRQLGLSFMTAGKARSDLQTLSANLLDEPEGLDIGTVASLTLAHLSSLRDSDGSGKLINECLALLFRCAEKKDKKADILSDALAEAMRS